MPNGTNLIASIKDILLLARGIAEDAKRIEMLDEQLKKDLANVSKSWLDDGIVEVSEYLTRMEKELTERKDNLVLVVQQLVAYAEELRKTI